MAAANAATMVPVLDVNLNDAEHEAAARARRLLSRVLSSQGRSGLARSLHVTAERTSRLKHRVACVTCRSRLDGLVAHLSSAANAPATEESQQRTFDQLAEFAVDANRGGPAPLAAWLSADAGLGLSPTENCLGNLGLFARFLAAFTSSTGEEVGEEASRRGGRASGVVRCPYHARSTGTMGRSSPSVPVSGVPLSRSVGASTPAQQKRERQREQRRAVQLLCSGMSEAEWETFGSVDVDDTVSDLFTWLQERGCCSTCIDTVAGALLELRRQCLEEDDDLAHPNTCAERSAERALASIGASCAAATGGVPEFLRVQGKLRHVSGIYRLEPAPFNDRPVYKKERPGMANKKEKPEAYIVYTVLGDWMISGQMDAGGAKCEGWAYAMEAAETPDKICSIWRVSGAAGWEEDPSLCITTFESLSPEFRSGIGYEDGSAVSQHLACDENGVLFVPLSEPDVLEEVLCSPTELPMRPCASECLHVATPEAAQQELYAWLRWLLRERLEKQRQNILTQAQVSHQLCRIFACAAMQQLEQVAEQLPPARKVKDNKKLRAKKREEMSVIEDVDCEHPIAAEIPSPPMDVDVQVWQRLVDDADSNASISTSPLLVSPVTERGWHTADSDGSASTRASSEEPPEVHRVLATKTRLLMQEMGRESKPVNDSALESSEVAAWLQKNPEYRQAVRVGRQRLQEQFQAWAGTRT